jgi:hypothetical protein
LLVNEALLTEGFFVSTRSPFGLWFWCSDRILKNLRSQMVPQDNA